MRESKRAVFVSLLAVGVLTLAAACGGGANEGRSQATVESVDVEARRVTLDHEDIPGLMQAMTMTFDVAPDVALDGLAPGDEVDFRVKYEGGVYTVTEIQPAGS